MKEGERLSLAEFPAVPAAAWEEQIRKDLKGADEKRLLWRTDEGFLVKPYYRREDVAEARPPLAEWRAWEAAQNAPEADVAAHEFHEAGATAVQEVAFAMAAGADLLAAGGERKEVRFSFGVGSTYFLEIAKLRAARLLWAQVAEAFGAAAAMRVHARTALANKSVLDPYVNLLRSTIEAMAAAVGGVDTLAVEAFGYEERLAENVQRILKEESRIDVTADPAAGSYFIEALTDLVAREAWKEFQAIEGEGGFAAALASGRIGQSIAESRRMRDAAVATRKRVLLGANQYPNAKEQVTAPLRSRLSSKDEKVGEAPAGGGPGKYGLPLWRAAAPFEAIRLRTARHKKSAGRAPRVFLHEAGDLKMRKARAQFGSNFFGMAGFEFVTQAADADLIVLCSSDAEYGALAADVCPRALAPVAVAGYPKDQVEALKAAGVAGFIYLGMNAVESLTEWQDRLGVQA